MAAHTVTFLNETDRPWIMALYQTLPDMVGLSSVSWKQAEAEPGKSAAVSWDLSHEVALLTHWQDGVRNIYLASQQLSTTPGKIWDVVFRNSLQQLVKDGDATDGRIVFRNVSNGMANVGIGMSGSASIVQGDLPSGANAAFSGEPDVWVALSRELVPGEVVTGIHMGAGPLRIVFPDDATAAILTAAMDGPDVVLSVMYGD